MRIRNAFLTSLTGVLLALPMLASASALDDMLDQSRFMMSRVAAVQAQFDMSKPSCVVSSSVPSVHVGEKFLLAWGSFGVVDTDVKKNEWPVNGAQFIVVDKPGMYRYNFKFYGAQGVSTACETVVRVSA